MSREHTGLPQMIHACVCGSSPPAKCVCTFSPGRRPFWSLPRLTPRRNEQQLVELPVEGTYVNTRGLPPLIILPDKSNASDPCRAATGNRRPGTSKNIVTHGEHRKEDERKLSSFKMKRKSSLVIHTFQRFLSDFQVLNPSIIFRFLFSFLWIENKHVGWLYSRFFFPPQDFGNFWNLFGNRCIPTYIDL